MYLLSYIARFLLLPICHNDIGPGTLYGLLFILGRHLSEADTGSILCIASRILLLGTMIPEDRKLPVKIRSPQLGREC